MEGRPRAARCRMMKVKMLVTVIADCLVVNMLHSAGEYMEVALTCLAEHFFKRGNERKLWIKAQGIFVIVVALILVSRSALIAKGTGNNNILY